MTAKPDIVERLRELASALINDPKHARLLAPGAITEFKKACTPQSILALLDEIAALRKRLEDAERERDEAYEAYRYLQQRLESIGYHGWAHDKDYAIRALAKGEKQQPQKTGD